MTFEADPAEYTPTVAEVASYIRARTKIAGGGIAGTFNDQTNVKGTEVEPLIDQAVGLILSDLGGPPCEAELCVQMKAVAAMLGAMLVEQSLFPEQTTGAGNSFSSLEKLYKPKMANLAEQVGRICGRGSGSEGAGGESVAKAIATMDDLPLIGPRGPVW